MATYEWVIAFGGVFGFLSAFAVGEPVEHCVNAGLGVRIPMESAQIQGRTWLLLCGDLPLAPK